MLVNSNLLLLGIFFLFLVTIRAMIKTTKSLQDAKNYVSKLKGKEIEVLVNLGRNKKARYSGTLSEIYPALFIVTPRSNVLVKTSFSYSELLCGGVKIRLKEG